MRTSPGKLPCGKTLDVHLELRVFACQRRVLLRQLGVFDPNQLLQVDNQLLQVCQPLHGLLRSLRLSRSLALVVGREVWHQLALLN